MTMNSETCKCDEPTPDLQHEYTVTVSGMQAINLDLLHRRLCVEPYAWHPGDDIESVLGPRIVELDDVYERDVYCNEWLLLCGHCGERLPFDRLSGDDVARLRTVGLVQGDAATSELVVINEFSDDVATNIASA